MYFQSPEEPADHRMGDEVIKTQVFDNSKLKAPQAGGDASVWRRREVEERRGVEHRREVGQRREIEQRKEVDHGWGVEEQRKEVEHGWGVGHRAGWEGRREVARDRVHVTELPAGVGDRQLGEFFAQFGRVAQAVVIQVFKNQVGGGGLGSMSTY